MNAEIHGRHDEANMAGKRRQRQRQKRWLTFKNVARPRITIILIALFVMVLIIAGRLVYLQVFDSTNQYAAQFDQSVDLVELTASRGNILDRNGNVLVQDSLAKKVYVVPNDVREDDIERVTEVLSQKLGLDYQEVYQIVTKSEDDIVEVKRGVGSTEAAQILAAVKEGFTYQDGTLYCCPAEITDSEAAAGTLQSILGMEYQTAESYVTQRENSLQLVKSRVDYTTANEVCEAAEYENPVTHETYDNGIKLVDDHKRYYTGSTFLADVLGFTNVDYHGAYGIEATCDGVLSGESGIVLYQRDAVGTDIPSQTQVIREAVSGEDVTLTIDMNIQSYVEEVLKETVEKWSSRSGTAIVMSSETGEILAMASYPTYSLDDPYTISQEYASHYASQLSGLNDDEQQQQMWRNPAVSLTYEPGSTFKAITSSAVLEEGVVTPDTTVYCDGSISVAGLSIKCTGNHGTQTVRQAIAHSCNPGLVTMIEQLDPFIFYKYAYNFGYGSSTGIELTGEEDGIFSRVINNDGEISLFDYATLSFGQGLATTPIQNLTALNAVVNDGYYVKPTILSENNSEELKRNTSDPKGKQVISSTTSQEMRNIMTDVVSAENNPTLAALVEGYSIGGKTGTAEQFVNGSYSEYATSFFCYGPVEDPKYTILVVLDGTSSDLTGGGTAAPAAISMMKYLLDGSAEGSGGTDVNVVQMPDLVGQDIETAQKLLEEKGIVYHITQQDAGSTVLSQSLEANAVYTAGTDVELVTGTSEADAVGTVVMPDLTGLSVQACNTRLNGLGLNMKISGSGFAAGQDPPAGTQVKKGTVVTVTFE